MLRLCALMDNLPSGNKALSNEHGLSLLVEKDDARIVFDCGQGAATWRNAHKLGANIDTCHAVILSHSHYDHAAGYRDLLELCSSVKELWTGEHFFEKKYSQNGIKYTDLSAGWGEEFLAKHDVRHHVVRDVEEISPGLWLVGGFERVFPFETIPQRYVKNTAAGMVPDDFADEICLVADTEHGLAVVVGCSHPGIVNMVQGVADKLHRSIYAVFGGVHLNAASDERVKQTLSTLKELGVQLFGFSHCSGQAVESMAAAEFGAGCCCHLAPGDCVML